MLNTVAYNDCWFYFELFKCCHFFRSGLQEMQNVYERWLSCSEDWAKSSWAVSLTTKSKEKKRGARRWMTRAQISKKYESDEKMKPEFAHQREEHPDVPWRKEPYLKTVNQPSFVAPISKNPIKVSAHTHTRVTKQLFPRLGWFDRSIILDQFIERSIETYHFSSHLSVNQLLSLSLFLSCAKDMQLFLVWDDESEEHLDSTILSNSHTSFDQGGQRNKRRKVSSSSDSEEMGFLFAWMVLASSPWSDTLPFSFTPSILYLLSWKNLHIKTKPSQPFTYLPASAVPED